MASDARKHIRDGYRDTLGSVRSIWVTLVFTCLSTVILGGIEDENLLTSADVAAPIVGKTRYEIFMVIAPAAIIILRIQIELQLNYLHRLARVVDDFRLRKPLRLGPENNGFFLIIGACGLHVAPPFALGFLGRHISAVYPSYAILLYLIAAAMLIWSAASLWRTTTGARRGSAMALCVTAGVAGAAMLYNPVMERFGFPTPLPNCTQRFDGPGATFSSNFLRTLVVERWDLRKLRASERNLRCLQASTSQIVESDLRATKFWNSYVVSSDLSGSDLSNAQFYFSILRDVDFTNVQGFQSSFFRADIDVSNFAGARFDQVWFKNGSIENSCFAGADLKFTEFGDANIFRVDFSGKMTGRANAAGPCGMLPATWKAENTTALKGADFRKAQLMEVNLEDVDLEGADFWGAELSDVDFGGANLKCARFVSTYFGRGVDFSGVAPDDLRRVLWDPDPVGAAGVELPPGLDASEIGSKYQDECEGGRL